MATNNWVESWSAKIQPKTLQRSAANQIKRNLVWRLSASWCFIFSINCLFIFVFSKNRNKKKGFYGYYGIPTEIQDNNEIQPNTKLKMSRKEYQQSPKIKDTW